MNKKIIKYIISFIIILSFISIFYMLSNKYADMSKYKTYSSDMDNMYINYTVKQLDKDINDKKSRIVYFGFSDCPYCNDLLPILTEVNKKYNQKIYYIDTRKNKKWKSNIDIDDYDLLLDIIGEYLEKDENDILHLYTPTIIFINKGKITRFIPPYEYDLEQGITENIKNKINIDLTNSFKLYIIEGINGN